ncbi:mannose-1-phosphate guanylyltransferase [Candidatus Woesebacteria bacterium]|nr:mannose-1-phosphate guanylyltransferase [Candidatus Woesebacteria bacterium]
MKAVIFAGGVGTRLWPLSRKKSPKQFEKVVGDKSTLQLAAERLLPEFAAEDIYISTGKDYIRMVQEQLPFVPHENIIAEPAKRDVGPAVALVMGYLATKFPDEPVVILWSDHLVKKIKLFKEIVARAGECVQDRPESIIFIGQKPRFPSENLGWIETGKVVREHGDIEFRTFEGFQYRPNAETAQRFFEDKHYCWNLGYFVTTPQFMTSLFRHHARDITAVTEKIVSAQTFDEFTSRLLAHYPEMPEISFDNAVLEKIDKQTAQVVVEDIGWSDVGAWEALKEALEQQRTDNITKGRVMLENSIDNLVYNYQDEKLIVGVNVSELLVVNTEDVLLVADKSAVKEIKKLVESFQGTENEKLT